MELRDHFKRQRLQLSKIDALERSLAATNLLCQQDFFKNSQRIACYMAHQQEMSCQAMMEMAWSLNKEVYLPVVDETHSLLIFKRYQAGDALEKNQFGILEPASAAKEINITELDLVVTPLVAFDKQGNRLGSGCGYYDRTFAEPQQRPTLCGLAYDFQEVDQLQAEAWDVPMDYVVTDLDVFSFNL